MHSKHTIQEYVQVVRQGIDRTFGQERPKK